ncbi:MAG: thermonuclease family protein [Vulcanimicrobiota bacterium]
MILRIASFIVFVIVLCSSPVFAESFTAKCISVDDGNVITVLKDGKEIKVKFAGVACPELKQEYGEKAKQITNDLVMGKDIWIDVKKLDYHGRCVAIVKTGDGKYVSTELVKTGAAWYNPKEWKNKELEKIEQESRSNRTGLWSGNNPIPPWEYRQQNSGIVPTSGNENINSTGTTRSSETVYITNTGKCYHRSGCRSLHSSSYPVSKNEAQKQYSPCSVCNP